MGSTLGPKAVREMEEIARRVLRENRNEGGHRARYQQAPVHNTAWMAKTTTTHAVGATKRVQRYTGPATTLVLSGTEVDAHNFFSDLTSGTICIIQPINGYFVISAADPCT